jgi:hypothetical protein
MRALLVGILGATSAALAMASCLDAELGEGDAGPGPLTDVTTIEAGTDDDAGTGPKPDGASTDAGPTTGATFSTDPAKLWVRAGTQTTCTVTLDRKGTLGDVSVSAIGLPQGVSVQAVIIPAGATTATLTLIAASNAADGDGTLTLTASGVSPKVVPLLVAGKPGSLDHSFGLDGLVIDGTEQGNFAAAALQPDGKIVAVGERIVGDAGAGYSVRRYGADGKPDTAFNQAIAPLLPKDGRATSMSFDPSGDLFVSGYGIIVRIDPTTPKLVTSFADGGTLFVPRPDSGLAEGVPFGYAVLGLGDAGVLTTSFLYRAGTRVDHYTDKGAKDTTFKNVDDRFASAYSLSVLPSGKYFVAGYRNTMLVPRGTRLRADGTVDLTMGLLGGVHCAPSIATTTPDGDAVYVGFSDQPKPGTVCMARLAADTNGDVRFATTYPPLRAGYYTRFSGGNSGGHPGLAIGANGGIYYDTEASDAGDKSASVHGHLGDGAADPTFGEGGVGPIFEDPASPDTYSYEISGVVATPDGRLVVVGARKGTQPGYFLARIWL